MKIILLITILLSSCAGPNPNPGERTADMGLISGQYDKFAPIVIKQAENGYPWAQLRAGMAYAYGYGVKKDLNKSIKYLYKAARQYDDNASLWEKGVIVGAIGESGYFNKNKNALLAHYHLAKIYYNEPSIKNVQKAKQNIEFVISKSEGKDVFFCCTFAGGKYITSSMIQDLNSKIIHN
jgi:TPR repeat protein